MFFPVIYFILMFIPSLLTSSRILGIIWMLFVGMIKFLQSSLTNKLGEIEGICIKLIDRWNRSDETRDRRHEQSNSENDRRHEQMLQAINRITDDLNYLKGRINNTPK